MEKWRERKGPGVDDRARLPSLLGGGSLDPGLMTTCPGSHDVFLIQMHLLQYGCVCGPTLDLQPHSLFR